MVSPAAAAPGPHGAEANEPAGMRVRVFWTARRPDCRTSIGAKETGTPWCVAIPQGCGLRDTANTHQPSVMQALSRIHISCQLIAQTTVRDGLRLATLIVRGEYRRRAKHGRLYRRSPRAARGQRNTDFLWVSQVDLQRPDRPMRTVAHGA